MSELRRTYCRVCHAACPLDIEVSANRVVGVHGVEEDPLFEGYTCIKGRQLPDQIHHPARLRATYRRAPDGRHEAVTSAEALDEIAAKVADIISRHGPRAIASYTGTGGYQNATSVAVARAWHKGMGSSSFYTSVTIDQPAKSVASPRLGIWEAGYHNFRDADVLMAVGYNPMVSSYGAVGGLQGTNPFTMLRRAKARGLKLIVVDPRRTELATQADVFLQVRPGEDAALLAGMVNLVLRRGWHDIEFCEQWVDQEQLAALGDAVAPFTLELVAERCDVPAADIETAVRMFCEGTRGTVGNGTGPNMSPHPTLAEHLSLVLNTICGRVNREGDTIESGWFLYPDTPKRAQLIPPFDARTGAPARFRELRGYRGEMPTTTLAEEILTPGEGQVRALFVSGGNPAVAWPDQDLTLRALADLELLVVIDHRMTPTAELAHYVVAPRLSLERADVPHLMDRWFAAPYTNWTPAVIEPEGDLLAEWEVFWEIARRNGTPIELPGGPLPMDTKPTDDDVIDLTYAGSRMPLDQIRTNRGVVHEDLAMTVAPADPDATGRFAVGYPEIIAELAVVASEGTSLEVMAGYDPAVHRFRLVSRRLKATLNSLGPELPGLAVKGTTNYAYMNPGDCDDLGLATGDLVRIASPHGELVGVAKRSADIRPGVVSMAHSWGGRSLTDEKVRDIGTPTNRLITPTDGFDPVTGMAIQSSIPVAVTPVPEDALVG
jgi:anaerobic selenocysteine-containing dehydrogenase